MQNHLSILKPGFIDAILAGSKTIECRLSRMGIIPHRKVKAGDLLWLKESAGPIRAVAAVGEVRGFEDLTPVRIDWLRRRFGRGIGAPAAFWRRYGDARFATLMWLVNVCPLHPFSVRKADRRAWVVLAAPPVPGEELIEAGAGLVESLGLA